MLKITNLHKSYANKEILHGISLEVEDGHIFGFIGHNGSGKSTTIRSVVGILEYESGMIEIDGLDIQKYPIEVKERTAFLPDNPDLYDNISAYQYLNFIGDMVGLEPSVRLKRIESLANDLEISEALGDKIKSLKWRTLDRICPLCAEKDTEVLSEKNKYGIIQRIVICKHCGLIYWDNGIDQTATNDFYDNYYVDNTGKMTKIQ